MARLGRPAIALDLGRLSAGDDPVLLAAAASREARLRGAGLVVGPVEPLVERGAAAVRAFAEQPGPVHPRRRPRLGPRLVARAAAHRRRAGALRRPAPRAVGRVAQRGRAGGLRPGRRHDRVPPHPRADRPGRAGRPPRGDRRDRPMTITDVAGGARAQNAAGLERLARRIEPTVGWDDLVLPSVVEAQLRELTARARHRDRVIGEWRMGTKGARGVGVTALFAGDSGTGKTMSAEVVGARPRARRLRDRPVDGRRQVHRRDREEPRPDLHGGRPGQRHPAVRRGRRAVRQAVRGQGRPRPVRQRRGRVPAPAHGALRRARDPDDEPALERRRGVRAPPGRDRRLPDARGGAPPPAVGGEPARRTCRSPTTSTSTSWPAGSRSRAATSGTCA